MSDITDYDSFWGILSGRIENIHLTKTLLKVFLEVLGIEVSFGPYFVHYFLIHVEILEILGYFEVSHFWTLTKSLL